MFSPEDFIIRRQCTPFCEIPCGFAGSHHPLLVAVINCTDPSKFTKIISKLMRRSWQKDDPIQDPLPEFRYPLVHWATVLGNVIVLKWCVEHGVDLNKRCGPRSETALHRFMVCGYSALKENADNELKTFKKLLNLLKVLLPTEDDNKDLPIHVGAKVLLERPLKDDPRFERTYTEMLKILVEKTAKHDMELLNHRNVDGNTMAHIVAQHNKGCEVLKLLLENGADCDLRNSEGLKPIDVARSKDATDVIRLLSKDEVVVQSSDLCVEEIADVDVIFIESDDDGVESVDRNNDEKDDAYILNLIKRIKSEPEDDPDWTLESTNTDLDACTSTDTLYTLDEDSYDIDDDDLSPVKGATSRNDSLFEESLNLRSSRSSKEDIESKPSNTRQTSHLKRKSSKSSDNSERISKKLHSDGKDTCKVKTSSKKSIESFLTGVLETNNQMDANTLNSSQSSILHGKNGKDNSSKLKRKHFEKGTVSGPDEKKQKAVSPKLEIELNMNRFRSLKKKVASKISKSLFGKSSRRLLTESMHSDSDGEATDLPAKDSDGEISKQEHKSDKNVNGSNLSSPKVEATLPGRCMSPTQDQHSDISSLSRIDESSANFTTTQPTTNQFSTKSSSVLPTEETSPSIEGEDEQSNDSSQRSFSSSEEIKSAIQRLQERLQDSRSNGPTNVNLTKLDELVDISKVAETAAGLPAGTSTPSPEPKEQPKSKKRLEDVVINLRERQHVGIIETATTQESVSESIRTMSGGQLSRQGGLEDPSSAGDNSIDEETSGPQSDSRIKQRVNATLQPQNDDAKSNQESDTAEEHLGAMTCNSVRRERESNATPVRNDVPVSATEAGQRTTQQMPTNVVIKKEVDDRKYGGNTLDDSLRAESLPKGFSGCTESNLRTHNTTQLVVRSVKQEKDESGNRCSGVSEENIAPQSEITVGNREVESDTSGGISRPTDGSGASNSTDVPGSVTGDGGESSLQQISKAVDKFCEEVYGVSPSKKTTDKNRDKNDCNHDSLTSMIDKICEEVYGISPGPQKQKGAEKQGDTSTHGERVQGPRQGAVDHVASSQRVQPPHIERTLPQSQVQIQGTLTSQSNVQRPVQVNVQSAVTQGQMTVASASQQSVQLSVTAPTQTQGIMQGQMQASGTALAPRLPNMALPTSQVSQLLANLRTSAVEVQQAPVRQAQLQTQRRLSIQRPGLVVTHNQQHIPRGYVTRPQPTVQPQQGHGELQNVMIQTPATQGRVTNGVQVPRVFLSTRDQSQLQAGRNQVPTQVEPVQPPTHRLSHARLQNSTTLTRANGHPQIVNQFSMNSQNASVERTHQNITRPIMIRSQIPLGKDNAVNYYARNRQILAQLTGENTAATQPTLQQLMNYLNAKSKISSGQTSVVGQKIQSTTQVQTTTSRSNSTHVNTSGQQAKTTPNSQSRGPSIATQAAIFTPNDGRPITPHAIGPDTATATAYKISKDPTIRESSNEPSNRDTRGADSSGSRVSTPSQTSPCSTPGESESRVIQLDDASNPDESEDEGLGLNGCPEADTVKDLFKDMSDISATKKTLEDFTKFVPKEDLVQLLEKAKNDRKDRIDKWTNEYEAAARCERHKYMEFESIREKIERSQENVKKMCAKIGEMKKQAEACRKEKNEAAAKKISFQNKIAEENEKIPIIKRLIATLTTEDEDVRSEQ